MTINQADQERTEQLLRNYTLRRLIDGSKETLELPSDQRLEYHGNEGYVLRKSQAIADNPFVEFRV